MHLGEAAKKETIGGHGIEDARSGQLDAVRGAEDRDEDGQCDPFGRGGAQDSCHRGGRDCVRLSGICGAQGDQIGGVREQVDRNQKHSTGQKGAREVALWIERFASAVRGKLPALVGPEHRNHRHTKVGEKRAACMCRPERGGYVRVVPPQREQNRAHRQNGADFDERRPVLQVRALPRTQRVHRRNHSNHRNGNDLCD